MADLGTTSGPEMTLEKTLEDLQIRSQVEETMQSMLIDVELAANLDKELEMQSQLHKMKEESLQHESALCEARAMQSHQKEQQASLADSLVKELWILSRELGHLQRWKQTHEATVLEHDELIAKLLQAEDRIELLESRPSASPPPSGAREEEKVAPAQVPATVVAVPSVAQVETTEVQETASVEHDDERKVQPFLSDEDKCSQDEAGPSEQAFDDVPTEDHEDADDAAVVALIEEQQQEEENDGPPNLDTLKMPVLTHIFEFLDALEILNTAQINVIMYSRVDALFGLGASEAEAPPPASIEVETRVAPDPPAAPQPLSNASAVGVSSNTIAALPAAPPPPPSTVPPAKLPSQPTSNASSAASSPRRPGGIFSMLQTRGVMADRQQQAGTAQQPLTAAMTDSMVAKLSDKELSAIFSLSEKLHQREKTVATLTREKEELTGRLEGTEAVKEFLIKKVRDVEQSLSKSQEDETKVTQQIASDQEVIAFLDGRVQELERKTKTLEDEKVAMEEKLESVQKQNEKKIEVLGDMLQFERERVSENEREWKATKKLLVKEIKSCRAQLLALQAERDGFREQNERLRKAVLATNASNGMT